MLMSHQDIAEGRGPKSDGALCITEAAKALNQRPREFFGWLANHQWIFKRGERDPWMAYQHRINAGLLAGNQNIVSVSGGKDSTAVYLLALESGRPFRAVFADTGNEHPATIEFLDKLADRTGGPNVETIRADFSDRIATRAANLEKRWLQDGISQERIDAVRAKLKATGNPFLDLCLLKGRFPSRMAQFCTQELKTLPIQMQVIFPALRSGPVLQWIGVRKDESAKRRNTPLYYRDDTGSMLWYPVRNWAADDVFALHRKHGLAPNPLYKQGMGRVGCMPCINVNKRELREIARRFPEQIDRIAWWEMLVAHVSKRAAATFLASGDDPVVSKRGDHADIWERVRWARTSRGGAQFVMELDEALSCHSEYGLCE